MPSAGWTRNAGATAKKAQVRAKSCTSIEVMAVVLVSPRRFNTG
jgi:hypothetical protein